MLDVGMSELLVFGIIALLVLGPDKLPEAARFVGKWYGKVKRLVSNVQNDIDRELRLSELREQMQQEMQRIAELEQKMQAQMSELEQQKREMFVQPSKQEQTRDNISYPIYHYMKEHPSFVYVEKYIQKAQTTIFSTSDHQPEFKVAV